MKLFLTPLSFLLLCGCHRETATAATTVPASSASASAPEAIAVSPDVVQHFKSGGRGATGGVTFTVRMLPKLIVSGPHHEIEQAEIDCVRGAEHGVLLVDTVHKRAEWGGLVFELGYSDVYHDDIELTIHRK